MRSLEHHVLITNKRVRDDKKEEETGVRGTAILSSSLGYHPPPQESGDFEGNILPLPSAPSPKRIRSELEPMPSSSSVGFDLSYLSLPDTHSDDGLPATARGKGRKSGLRWRRWKSALEEPGSP